MGVGRLQQLLHELQRHEPIQVAFVMEDTGALVAWAGHSPAFSPTGSFAPREADKEPNDNLYLTPLGEHHFLGVLFAQEQDMEQVRGLIVGREPALVACLKP